MSKNGKNSYKSIKAPKNWSSKILKSPFLRKRLLRQNVAYLMENDFKNAIFRPNLKFK